MNLPNWSTNTHLRRVLQSMQPDYTTIFGGRDRELAALDAWLKDDANPYALLLAPTGRGKTALVWHWLTRHQHEWQIIFVPISIRYGNSNQADVLVALTHAFAHMHGELDEFSALQQTPSELQPKLAAYLRRDLPDNTRVLLAIDGLDEATGWELGADLLPADPPANLKILLSARDMAQHQRADWYHKLGLRSEQTRDFTLGGLDRLALRELLITLGTPLEELAADFDVLGELLRVSAGDPVIVRLLVQLLREERIQIGQISQLPADDLNAVFGLWLNQLSAQQSEYAQILLLLLANAYGPLSARDLLGLAGDHFADAEQIAQAIAPLARFVIGDAETGYVFSHQKLRELYRDRLDAQTLAEWNARFVRYGKQAYREPTPYLCRFLVNHVRDAGEWQFARHLLADFNPKQAWAEARYALEGSYSGYLRDLDVLQSWANEQNDLALNIHCSLIASSIISLSSNINGELLAQLVKVGTTKGKWSVEAALAHIEHQPEVSIMKLKCLIEAGIAVPWERALDLVEQEKEQHIHNYLLIYPLVPQSFQAALQERILNLWAAEQEVIHFINNLGYLYLIDQSFQTTLWEKLLKLDGEQINTMLYYKWPGIPEPWKTRVYQKIQDYAKKQFQELVPHKPYKGRDIPDILSHWDFLTSEQQSLSYWGISFEQFLQKSWPKAILKSLPAHDLQACITYLQQGDWLKQAQQQLPDARYPMLRYLQNGLAILATTNTLTTQILDQIQNLILAAPQYFSPDLLQYLPETFPDQLAQSILNNIQSKPEAHQNANMLRELIPLVPEYAVVLTDHLYQICLASQDKHSSNSYMSLPLFDTARQQALIEQIYQSKQHIASFENGILLYIELLPYLPAAQQAERSQALLQQIQQTIPMGGQDQVYENLLKHQPQLNTQIWQLIFEALPDSECNIFDELLTYFDSQERSEMIAQLFEHNFHKSRAIYYAIYPYLNAEQQEIMFNVAKQYEDYMLTRAIFSSLLNSPNYPYLQLIPVIEQFPKIGERLHSLAIMLDRVPPQQIPSVKSVIQSTLEQFFVNDRTVDNIIQSAIYNPKLANVVVDYYLQDLEQNFERISTRYALHDPIVQQRLGQALWPYLQTKPEWPFTAIINNRALFYYCLPYFDQAQIQQALHTLSHEDIRYHLDELQPYLTHQHLQQLDPLIKTFHLTALVRFYRKASKHHPDYIQTNYYQFLIERFYAEQPIITTSHYFSLLHDIAPYLQQPDRIALIEAHLQRLHTPFIDDQDNRDYAEIIALLHDNALFNQRTIKALVTFAAKHTRKAALNLLTTLLPPYLGTLTVDQQQQLAAQIAHSVEQVTTAWP